jgi:hypothetical protein
VIHVLIKTLSEALEVNVTDGIAWLIVVHFVGKVLESDENLVLAYWEHPVGHGVGKVELAQLLLNQSLLLWYDWSLGEFSGIKVEVW